MHAAPSPWQVTDRQLTRQPYGHILTNTGCWSADGQWVLYDTRSDPAGNVFDGEFIERVHARTGEVQRLYAAQHGARVGVVTCCPQTDRIVFIHGPEHPTADWQYGATRRRGVVLHTHSGRLEPLDAVCLAEPFQPGALRGGSHVHTFDPAGNWVAFTYEDEVLERLQGRDGAERNQRNIGISVPAASAHPAQHLVAVNANHPRNVAGTFFSVLVSRTWDQPVPASDQISRAYEDAWIGEQGYLDRAAQGWRKSLAFIGDVHAEPGVEATERQITERQITERQITAHKIPELFVVDLPEELTVAGDEGPLAGTATTRPRPPRGVRQRRLTYTSERRYPGLSGPRHWPRSAPDGSEIYCLMRDSAGIVQLWGVSPLGGEPRQVSWLDSDVASAFSVARDGKWIAHVADGSVCLTATESGVTYRLTAARRGDAAPRPEACVLSPDGRSIAYVRRQRMADLWWNQVCVVDLPGLD
jgi:hypothetical protein